MKAAEIRELSVDEIHERIDESREELMALRFQQASGELVDFTKIRIIRREIARYLTILNEMDRETAMEGEA
jgi:large subunit ribosomal protein L29